MKNKLFLPIAFIFTVGLQNLQSQTVYQVCVSEPEDNICSGSGVFVPGNLTIEVGDQIQFTTQYVALSGYTGSNHTIEFTGSPANNVTLPVSADLFNQVTTVTTPPFNTPGTFPMECTNFNHCILSTSSCSGYSVTVTGAGCDVVADFTASSNTVCAGSEVSFTNTSTDATDYEWEIDGTQFSTDENPVYTFSDPGTYEITLIASDANCSETTSQTIEVYPIPDAIITLDPASDLIVNQEVDINFTTTNTDANTTYSWVFCDNGSGAAFDEDFTYSWNETGTFCACLTLENDNGCSNEICVNEIIVEDINELNENELKKLVELYPNPNSGKFKVIIHSSDVLAVKIVNNQGQTLVYFGKNEIQNNGIDVDSMASGNYFLVIETLNRKGSLQFIVE